MAWADLIDTSAIIGDGGPKGVIQTNTADKFFYRLREGSIRRGFNSKKLLANDDYSTELELLGFTINLFDEQRMQCYLNNNGRISFGAEVDTFTRLPLQTAASEIGVNTRLIAPFWADVDTRSAPDLTSGAKEVTFGQGTIDTSLPGEP